MFESDAIALTWHEALSGVFGSVSVAAWVFLLIPQLVENYLQKSADGLSLTFLILWFVGDVANLAGAVLAGLVPTVVATAGYFCIADVILISQTLYYKHVYNHGEEEADEPNSERAPLLSQPSGIEIPRRKSLAHRHFNAADQRRNTLTSRPSMSLIRRQTTRYQPHPEPAEPQPEEKSSASSEFCKDTLAVIGLFLVGSAAWLIAYKTGAWQPTPVGGESGDDETPLAGVILGYGSAILYLGARIPQIIKNQRERSCEGLSLLFFILSLIGNLTYGAGIVSHSTEKEYFMTNLPWLIGSLGTMAEDVIIFVQFSVFGDKSAEGDGYSKV